MMSVRVRAIAAVLAALAAVPSAWADPRSAFLARLVGHLERKGESFACFSRRYDDSYLAAHPRQNVAYAKMLVSAYFRESSLDPKYSAYSYQLGLAFKFRGRPEQLTSVAECGSKDSPRGAECAGPVGSDGNMRLALESDRAVLMTIPHGSDLWAPGPVEQRHAVVKNPFGDDDKAFRLERAPLSECDDLAFERQKPLRPHEP
jgi:hypothetical protein